jgi:aspartate/methionine/tyrosine aminotransferase
MRDELVSPSRGGLTYEIRHIVSVAEKLQKVGIPINWENIGDPIAKGEIVPDWMKEIVANTVFDNRSWGYSHTRGLLKTREFVCTLTNKRQGVQITPDDVLFFNGLGDAIGKLYSCLRPEVRVILPSPTYTTHSLGEANHARASLVQYRLRPEAHWLPDLEDLENHVRYNSQIGGILLINPDNPTGMVLPTEMLVDIVAIAKKYDLFIIADEVYINLTYNGVSTVPISDVIGDVPAIAMKGISKEFPWPGARCGWLEVYNGGKDSHFDQYVNRLLTLKMNEVCSTTLPQMVIPEIMSHPRYSEYLAQRNQQYERMSGITYDFLSSVDGLHVNRTNGAFYNSVVFKEGLLNARQSLPLVNVEAQALIEPIVNAPGVALDKRFVYYLLAHTGICVVPLSSFATELQGFRVTLLERDEAECRRIYKTLAAALAQYLA